MSTVTSGNKPGLRRFRAPLHHRRSHLDRSPHPDHSYTSHNVFDHTWANDHLFQYSGHNPHTGMIGMNDWNPQLVNPHSQKAQ